MTNKDIVFATDGSTDYATWRETVEATGAYTWEVAKDARESVMRILNEVARSAPAVNATDEATDSWR